MIKADALQELVRLRAVLCRLSRVGYPAGALGSREIPTRSRPSRRRMLTHRLARGADRVPRGRLGRDAAAEQIAANYRRMIDVYANAAER
jgi:hypothetical protein